MEVTVGKIGTVDMVGLGLPLAGEAVTDGTGTEIEIDMRMIVIEIGSKRRKASLNFDATGLFCV